MSSQREQLFSNLQRIKQNQFELPEEEKAFDYLPLMLTYIGDPDPDLRDYLIYKTFYQWIIVKRYFSEEERRYILSVVTDKDYLFYQIGNTGDHSVFTRTFSVLIVALILASHRKKPFIDEKLFQETKEKLIRYYWEEKDLRAYVEEEGWADSVSHGADALDELVACPESNEQICREVLEVIGNALYNGRYIFRDEEDERITCVIYRIIKDHLVPDEVIIKWIEGLTHCCKREYNRNQHITRINVKNFIRSLYFRILHHHTNLEQIHTLLQIEARLNLYIT